MSQFIEHLEKMRDRAGQPIAGPDQQNVELSLAGIRHQLVEPWPGSPGPRNFIFVDSDNLQAALLGQLPEIMQLSFGMLVEGRDTQVKGSLFHNSPFKSRRASCPSTPFSSSFHWSSFSQSGWSL